jgi:hypothetical protein
VNHALLLLLMAVPSSSWATQAQPVPIPEDPSTSPQIEISGVGIGTLDYGKTADRANGKSAINLSDSSLFVGAAQRLYQGGIGSFGLGGLTTEDTNKGTNTSLFLHQAFVDYQTESFEALIGRSDNPTAHIVDLPTLRGDDLITLTTPLNPFSNGGNSEEHRYSNVASFTYNQGLKYFENIHAQHLINSAGIGSDTAINSFGVSVYSLGAPGLEALERVPSWGFGYEQVTMQNNAPNGLHQFFAGGTLRLNDSVTNRWDLKLQNTVNWGSRLATFSNVTDSFQANSNSISGSLRYLASPFGHPGYQLALTLAQKKYFNVSGSSSIGGALTGVKRLGQGFDFVAQYLGQWRDSSLANVQSKAHTYEQVGEVGFAFNFDATLNEHLTPRRTLMNQQHQYVPN